MRYLSICSGIEAASMAWESLGWSPVGFSEIEPFPSAVLQHHWPHVPNFGDMTRFWEWPEEVFAEADVIVGGTPCQAWSVAGLRGGLEDPRGNLTLVFVQLVKHADEIRSKYGKPPVIILWENVPGVLSSRDNGFGCFLGGLAGENEALVPSGKRWTRAGCVLGAERTIAWRVLDAQYFGVPQRRDRVFVVAGAGDFSPPEILFERESLQWNPAPRRDTGQVVAALTANGVGVSGADNNQAQAGHLIPIAFSANQEGGAQGSTSTTPPLIASNGGNNVPCIAFGGNNTSGPIQVATARNACSSPSGRMDFETETFLVEPDTLGVRRITPKESERLQGFPDNHTLIPWKGKPPEDCPDGHRQKAVGNSMAVPVIRWIGSRIQEHIAI